MIKKILSTLLVSYALFVFAATGSFAERPTIAIGASVAYGGFNASGTENEGNSTKDSVEKHQRDVSGAFGYTSFFLEASFADRVTLGASWMADAITTEATSRTDAIAPGSESMSGGTADIGTSSVSARLSNLTTGYIEVNIWNGLYAKYGIMEMDVDTKESLHTDSSYPNAKMDGTTYGLGWKGSFDNGLFIKTETMMQDWTDLKLNATGLRVTDPVSVINNNSVELTLKGAVASISIGKAF